MKLFNVAYMFLVNMMSSFYPLDTDVISDLGMRLFIDLFKNTIRLSCVVVSTRYEDHLPFIVGVTQIFEQIASFLLFAFTLLNLRISFSSVFCMEFRLL